MNQHRYQAYVAIHRALTTARAILPTCTCTPTERQFAAFANCNGLPQQPAPCATCQINQARAALLQLLVVHILKSRIRKTLHPQQQKNDPCGPPSS